jgi:hypothetical protein
LAVDPEYLKRQYAAMPDEALLAMVPEDLTPVARGCFDAEILRRGLREKLDDVEVEEVWDASASRFDEPEPDWMEDAQLACTFTEAPGKHVSPEVDAALDVLSQADIPCSIRVREDDPPYKHYDVMVPAKDNYHAMAVLDKEIFNATVEAEYRMHFENLSNDEFLAIHPQALVAGMADRMERLLRVYKEERLRRELA